MVRSTAAVWEYALFWSIIVLRSFHSEIIWICESIYAFKQFLRVERKFEFLCCRFVNNAASDESNTHFSLMWMDLTFLKILLYHFWTVFSRIRHCIQLKLSHVTFIIFFLILVPIYQHNIDKKQFMSLSLSLESATLWLKTFYSLIWQLVQVCEHEQCNQHQSRRKQVNLYKLKYILVSSKMGSFVGCLWLVKSWNIKIFP